MSATQTTSDLSDLLTARGLHLILKPLPGSPPISHKHDLNVLIMNRDDLVRYAKPMTDLELALYTHLKEMAETYGEARDREQLEADFEEQRKELETANDTIENMKEQITELEERLVGELV